MLSEILGHLSNTPSRTGSLIITLYGDAIAPRGGSLWLGNLLEVFRAMDVGDGVVRTAVSRLAADGWLARARVGRNSFYRLAERGQVATDAATPRIYGALAPVWDGRLHLVVADPGPGRQALVEAGCGTILPGLMASPFAMASAAGLALRAEADGATARALAARAWPLGEVAARYERFLEIFPAVSPASDLEALILRMLLIQEYRRVVLRDPHLPAALLPERWPGFAARAQCARLYEALREGSEKWLDLHGVAEEGALPPAVAPRRF